MRVKLAIFTGTILLSSLYDDHLSVSPQKIQDARRKFPIQKQYVTCVQCVFV